MEMAADRLCTLIAAGFLTALVAGLAGCGQKGPLYIPDKGGDVVTRPGGQTQQPRPQSQETAPQPSTQPQPNGTEDEKKNQQPPPR
jgi:predicted small lipoprotein YifL